MSHVYIVVATKNADVEICESFAGAAHALGRAFQLSSDKSGTGRTDLFNPSPQEETMTDGSVRWVFMNTNKQSVIVTYRKIETALLSQNNPISVVGVNQVVTAANSPVVQKYLPVYDFKDRSLPAGWTNSGKPVLMDYMLDHPLDIISPLTLSEGQKWALITARIRKSPNFKNKQSNLDSRDILLELRKKSALGLAIRDIEMQELQELHYDLLHG